MLNQIRREAVEQLQALQTQTAPLHVRSAESQLEAAMARRLRYDSTSAISQLHLLVRTPEQLEAAIEGRPASITLDYLDLYGLKPSVERLKASGITARVASPRIFETR